MRRATAALVRRRRGGSHEQLIIKKTPEISLARDSTNFRADQPVRFFLRACGACRHHSRFGGGHRKAPAVDFFAWGLPVRAISTKPDAPRLVDLSKTPSGTFSWRSTLPRKWHANIDQIAVFPVCVIALTPKTRKTFFAKVLSEKSRFLAYRQPRGIYADLTSKL